MSRETRNMGISTSTFNIMRINNHLQHKIDDKKTSLTLIQSYLNYIVFYAEEHQTKISYVLREIIYEYLDEIDESFEFVNFSHLCENAINYKRIKLKIAARVLKDLAEKKQKEEAFEDYEGILHIPGYKTVKVMRRLE